MHDAPPPPHREARLLRSAAVSKIEPTAQPESLRTEVTHGAWRFQRNPTRARDRPALPRGWRCARRTPIAPPPCSSSRGSPRWCNSSRCTPPGTPRGGTPTRARRRVPWTETRRRVPSARGSGRRSSWRGRLAPRRRPWRARAPTKRGRWRSTFSVFRRGIYW